MRVHPSRSRRHARVGVLAATGALAAGLLSAAVTPAVAAPAVPTVAGASPLAITVPTPPPLVWTGCETAALQAAGAQCSFVTVPTDYDDVSAGTIRIAISRVKHTSAAYQGVVLANPGGPGGSGLRLATLGQRVPATLAAQYDWVGFDPRGVGSSQPALHCDPSFFGYDRPDYTATTPALRQVWLDRVAGYSQSCAANNDLRLLNHMTTLDNVRDMESIRLALGRKQINYYGFSYGTYLGQVYASLYPGNLRRAVFDSNVDPRRVWYNANLDQDVAFETTTEAFFAWVAQNDAAYQLGTTAAEVEAKYLAVLDQLRATPENDGKVGPDEWNDAFVPAGYYQSSWTTVAYIFVSAYHLDDYTPVTANVQGPTDDDNGYAVYLATQCTDTTSWPRSYSRTWEPDALRVAQTAPFITWNNTWYNAACLTWPAAPHTEVPVVGKAAQSLLLVDEQFDAATPYAGSVEVRKRFPGARLIQVVGGTSHAVSLRGNTCTDTVIVGYLTDGTLPARKASTTGPDKSCAARPLPTPPGAPVPTAPRGAGGVVSGPRAQAQAF